MSSKCKTCKAFFLFSVSVFAFLVIFHRIGCYFYEYDPQFAPYDYGRFNFFSFFTVQSNIFAAVYLFAKSLSYFGIGRFEFISSEPLIGAFVTVYIIVTGAVYCCGIPLGFTPPFVWDTSVHAMSSFIQVFHHMIIPPLMIILWFFPDDKAKLSYRMLPLFGIYPLIYSLFSIVRGKISNPHFYAYPFYNPQFVYNLFKPSSDYSGGISGYLLMIPLLIVGIGMFIAISALVLKIHNSRIERKNI